MSIPSSESDFRELDWSRHFATEMRFRGATDDQVADAQATAEAHYLDGVDTPRVDLPVWSGWAVAVACLTGWLVLLLRQRRRQAAEPPRRTTPEEQR